MNTRLTVVGLAVVALVTVGVVGSRIEHSKHGQSVTDTAPADASGPDWANNVLADATEQQTDLDNLNADAQLPDPAAVATDSAGIQSSLDSWTADEATITDVTIRASYTNTILQMRAAVSAADNKDLTSVSDHVTSAQTFLNATVDAIQAQGSGN